MFFWVPVKVNRYENRSGYGPCLNPKMPDFLNDNGHESFLKKYITVTSILPLSYLTGSSTHNC